MIAGTAVLALAGIGGGVAFASSSTPGTTPATPTPSASAAPSGQRAHARNLLARTEHGQLTVRTKHGTEVVDVQRGTVTAVGSTSVTVRSRDGFSARYSVGPKSTIREHKQAAKIASVHVGDRVRVVAVGNTVRGLADAGS